MTNRVDSPLARLWAAKREPLSARRVWDPVTFQRQCTRGRTQQPRPRVKVRDGRDATALVLHNRHEVSASEGLQHVALPLVGPQRPLLLGEAVLVAQGGGAVKTPQLGHTDDAALLGRTGEVPE